MKRKRNTLYLGLFVLVALVLLVVILMSIGGRSVFTQQARYTLFFDKSVKGLSVGSPIMFRGVRIGQVKTIQFSNSQKLDDGTLYWPIEVGVEIDPHSLDIGKSDSFSNDSLMDKTTRNSLLIFKGQELVDQWLYRMVCDHGLCAQLQSLSFLTGQLYIQLDFFQGADITTKEQKDLARHIIPTRISVFERMYLSLNRKEQTDVFNDAVLQITDFISSGKAKSTLENLSSTADNLNAISGSAREAIDELKNNSKGTAFSVLTVVANANNALVNVNKLLETVNGSAPELMTDVKDTIANINDRVNGLGAHAEKLLANLQSLTSRVNEFADSKDGQGAKLLEEISGMTTQIKGTFNELQKTITQLQQYIAPDSQEREMLQNTLEQIERAANSIRNLSDTVQRNPEALLWGKKN